MSDWVDMSAKGRNHQYLCLEYEDFPYTLIISGQMTTLVAGHNLNEPGVIVARNLFRIFSEDAPEDIEELKSKANALALRFLDIAFAAKDLR